MACAAVSMNSCQDTWDDHYGKTADTEYGNASLYEVMSAQPELSDFCKVLEATKAFANFKQTNVNYATLLGTDQFFTVWAPVNGTFNVDSLLQLCKTSEGDSLVELHFVKNHVARYSHSQNMNEQDVLMLNNKSHEMNASEFGFVGFEKSNIATRNGVLHTLQKPVSYYYNIYEALVAKDEYKHIGSFLRSYQIDELDETSSLAMGIVDGKTIYIDSVFTSKNDLLHDESYNRQYGYLNREDSTYWMIVPTQALWQQLYAEAETYYNFAFIEKADSVHERWSHYALMQDLVYNPHVQTSINDSITSTTFYKDKLSTFHTYYKPFGEFDGNAIKSGLFNQNWVKTEQCSNGMIYMVDEWPFAKENTYFKRINVEAEGQMPKYEEGATGKKMVMETYYSLSDSVSNGMYVVFTPASQTDAYFCEYELPDVLSGTYDVCVVVLPRSVNPTLPFSNDIKPAGIRNQRPIKFKAQISYAGTDGKTYTIDSQSRYTIDTENPSYYVKTTDKNVDYLFESNVDPTKNKRSFANNPYCVDTIKLVTMHFPTCNYDQNEITNRLRLTNTITSSEASNVTYWGTWFIDRILLLPHKDEVNE